MSAVSHEVWGVRRPAMRWTGLTALVLLTACGGERRESPGAGTEGVVVTDSVPTATADSVAVATADTAAPTATDASPGDAARDTAAKPAKPAKAAKPAVPKPEPAAPAQAEAPAAPAQDPAATGQDTAAAARGEPAGESQTGTAPLRDEYHQAPRDTVDQATYDGWKQFNLNCARCHGEDVLGTTIAPHLLLSLKADGPINTPELFMQVVCAGRPEKGMPSWCALGMEPAKISEMYSYVKGRSEGKLRPGRPARKPGS